MTHSRIRLEDLNISVRRYAPEHYGIIFFVSTLFFSVLSEIFISWAVSQGILFIFFAMLFNSIIFLRYQYILHESSHGVISRHKILNKFMGEISGLIVLYPFQQYKHNHIAHHAQTGTHSDPEIDNFIDSSSGVSQSKQFLLKVARSFFMLDALKILSTVFLPSRKKNQEVGFGKWIIFCFIWSIQFLLLTSFTNNLYESLLAIVIFGVSVASFTFTLNRIRGICEHTISDDLSNVNYTRTHISGLLAYILGPLNFRFHVEHHYFPGISSYYYPIISTALKNHFKDNSWYSESYFKTIKSFFK